MKKVSVIIPVYNAEPYLRQCLDSVINQTLKEIEIICVDDGSTDHSLEILESYADKDSRVRILTQENRSAGVARNRGLAEAEGEYLSFLDADDFFETNMLEISYRDALSKNADIIVFRSNQYDDRKHTYINSAWTIKENYLPDLEVFAHGDVRHNFFEIFAGWTWDKLFRRHFIQKNDITFQDQKSINDLLFVYSALARARRIAVVQDVFAHKRTNNENSISSNFSSSKQWECVYYALLALKEKLVSWGIYEELKQDYINYALKFTLWNVNKFIHTETYAELYKKLKNGWLENLGILDEPAPYFYDQGNFNKLSEILELNAEEYKCIAEVRTADQGNFLFPFELVKQRSKIILYGAGDAGKTFYRQIKYTNFCEITAWCDRQYQLLGHLYCDPEKIRELDFDCIVIAVNDESLALRIVSDIKSMGVGVDKIIWRKPEVNL